MRYTRIFQQIYFSIFKKSKIKALNNIDIFSKEFENNFSTFYSNLYSSNVDVVFIKESNCYLVYKFDYVKQLFHDNELGFETLGKLTFLSDLVLLGSDADKHKKNKNHILDTLPILRKKELDALNSYVQLCYNELYSKTKSKNSIDLAGEFVNPFVLSVIMKEFGIGNIPNELNIFSNKDEIPVGINTVFDDWKALNKVIVDNINSQQISEKVAHLIQSVIQTDNTINPVDFLRFLIFSGAETTSSFILFALQSIFQKPEIINDITDNPENMNSFLNEVARFYSPVQFAYRSTIKKNRIGKSEIPAKATLVLAIGVANRDPDVFENPKEFIWNRQSSNISFGAGKYKCIGEYLAKHVTSLFLSNFLKTINEFKLVNITTTLTLGNGINRIGKFNVERNY